MHKGHYSRLFFISYGEKKQTNHVTKTKTKSVVVALKADKIKTTENWQSKSLH